MDETHNINNRHFIKGINYHLYSCHNIKAMLKYDSTDAFFNTSVIKPIPPNPHKYRDESYNYPVVSLNKFGYK